MLFELTQSTPTSPLMLSQMTTAAVAVPLPQGDVTVKFLKVMFSQMALMYISHLLRSLKCCILQEKSDAYFGLELHVREATARPYLPDVYPEKFSKCTFVTFTCEGYAAHVVALICCRNSAMWPKTNPEAGTKRSGNSVAGGGGGNTHVEVARI